MCSCPASGMDRPAGLPSKDARSLYEEWGLTFKVTEVLGKKTRGHENKLMPDTDTWAEKRFQKLILHKPEESVYFAFAKAHRQEGGA